MTYRIKPGNGRQRGMTLIEVLAALAIGAMLLAGLATLVQRSLDDMKGQQAAYYQAQVTEAARRYLDRNAPALEAQTPTAANVLALALRDLREARLLPAGFADLNPYGQRSCVLVRRPDPARRLFDALIVTTAGQPIGDEDLPSVAMQAGSGGGYIAGARFGEARGASWRMPTTAFRGVTCADAPAPALGGTKDDGGHLASSLFYDGATQQTADFVYRGQVPGHPEANTMSTPLRFSALVAAGTSCADEAGNTAGIAVDGATRAVVTCGSDGKWSLPPSWKDPVATYDALVAVPGPKEGDVRMVTGLRRAFTYYASETRWVALAVDQDGNFAVPNNATVGQDLKVGNNALVKYDVISDGVKAGGWMEAPAVHVTDIFAAGAACHLPDVDRFGNPSIAYPYGTIVTDAAQRPLICGPDKTFRYSNGKYTID